MHHHREPLGVTLHHLQIRILIDVVIDPLRVTVRITMHHNARMQAARAPITRTSAVRTYRLIVLRWVSVFGITLVQRDVAVRRLSHSK